MSSDQSIAERAYHLWIARGRPHGAEEEHWLEAERQLAAEKANGAAALSGDTPTVGEDTPAVSGDAASPAPPRPKPTRAATAKGKRKATSQSSPPVDETDAGPATAPGDIGEC